MESEGENEVNLPKRLKIENKSDGATANTKETTSKVEVFDKNKKDGESAKVIPEVDAPIPGKTPSVVRACFTEFKQTSTYRSAKCRQCCSMIRDGSQTTSNFLRHIRQPDHKAAEKTYNEFVPTTPASQRTLDTMLTNSSVVPYKPCHPQQKKISSLIVKTVIDMSLPFSSVEHQTFRELLKACDPKLRIMTSKTLKNRLAEDGEQIKAKIRTHLSQAKSVSITLDIWSDRKMRGYMALTCHFIADAIIKSALLSCDRFTGSHTGERIFSVYDSVVSEYDIGDKVKYIITDNASNMRKAFSTSFETIDDDNMPTDVDEEELWEGEKDVELVTEEAADADRFVYLNCFAHTLQLSVRDALASTRSVNSARGKAKSIASKLHTSTKFKEEFEARFGENRGIPQPNDTRWNSTLAHLKGIVYLNGKTDEPPSFRNLHDALVASKLDNLKFTLKEWGQLVEMVDLLDPFLEATNHTQGEKNVTISYVVPGVLALYKHVSEFSANNLSTTRKTFLTSLKTRFRGIFMRIAGENVLDNEEAKKIPYYNEVYFMATLLDPNWGSSWIEHYVEECYRSDFLESIKAMVLSRVDKQSTSGPEVKKPSKPHMKGVLFSKFQKSTTATGIEQVIRFLDVANSAIEELDPLQFWQQNSSTFSQLYPVAQVVLSIPATSAAVERVFSHGGITMRSHRASMSADTLSKVIFSKCNGIFLSK